VRRRQLGRIGPLTSAIGLGCMPMFGSFGSAADADGIATIQGALDVVNPRTWCGRNGATPTLAVGSVPHLKAIPCCNVSRRDDRQRVPDGRARPKGAP
jgi:hypothetical protein